MAIEHLPPDDIQLNSSDRLYFLAGPIQGAPNWQAVGFTVIDTLAPNRTAHVANPRREYLDNTFDYARQATWEDRGRLRAAQNGALIFWLAARDYSLPHDEDRAYAQTTRFEFAEAYGWLQFDPYVQISLGIEPGYAGSEKYYRYQAARFSIPVHDTLEATCAHALKVKR